MGIAKAGGGIVFVGSIIAITFVAFLFLIKALWAWTIPDLFPGAVEQGLVAESISWFTAAKLAIFVAILSGLAGTKHETHKAD